MVHRGWGQEFDGRLTFVYLFSTIKLQKALLIGQSERIGLPEADGMAAMF